MIPQNSAETYEAQVYRALRDLCRRASGVGEDVMREIVPQLVRANSAATRIAGSITYKLEAFNSDVIRAIEAMVTIMRESGLPAGVGISPVDTKSGKMFIISARTPALLHRAINQADAKLGGEGKLLDSAAQAQGSAA